MLTHALSSSLSVSALSSQECRLRDMTYAAPILVDVEYVRGRRLVRRNNVVIGRMPIMLRSCKCVLADKNRKELADIKEVSEEESSSSSASAIAAHARMQADADCPRV